MITVTKTALEDVRLIQPSLFEDFRGFYLETFNEKEYQEAGIDVRFVTDDISISRKHVLRGIHGDGQTWKLISCLYGSFYFVVVNCNLESLGFGKWVSFTLSDVNRRQVLVPPKHGNAHLVMSDMCIFHYKQSAYYAGAEHQFTYRYNDPRCGIWWPIKNPLLSERDEKTEVV